MEFEFSDINSETMYATFKLDEYCERSYEKDRDDIGNIFAQIVCIRRTDIPRYMQAHIGGVYLIILYFRSSHFSC